MYYNSIQCSVCVTKMTTMTTKVGSDVSSWPDRRSLVIVEIILCQAFFRFTVATSRQGDMEYKNKKGRGKVTIVKLFSFGYFVSFGRG